MKEKLLELLWDLENYKYPEYDKKADEILRLFSVSGQLPLDFVKWYSGMEQEKILKAYERWIKESGNLR